MNSRIRSRWTVGAALLLVVASLPFVATTEARAEGAPYLRAEPWGGFPPGEPAGSFLAGINGYENEVDKFRFQITTASTNQPVTVEWSGNLPDDALIDGAEIGPAETVPGGTTFEWNPGETTGSFQENCYFPDTGNTAVGECYWVTITATDSIGQSTAVNVYLRVVEDRNPPDITILDLSPSDGTVAIGETLSFRLEAVDTDIPAAPIVYEILPDMLALGATMDPVSGEFSWTPSEGQDGTYTVAAIAVEDGPSYGYPPDTGSVEVPVVVGNGGSDLPPTVEPIDDLTVGEGTPISIPVYADDPDGDAFDLAVTSGPGTITFGWYEWSTGEVDGPGTYPVTVTAENALTGSASFTITVNEVNQPPVATTPVHPQQDVAVGETLSLTVEATDPDLPAQQISFEMFSGVGDVHPTTGAFSYTPGAGDLGSQAATVRIYDDAGGEAFSEIPILVTEGSGNLPPDAVEDSYTTSEDTLLSVPAPGVLGNDKDPENDPLIAVLVDAPDHGHFELRETGDFDYNPTPNFNGIDTFTYYAFDGQASALATVTLRVTSVNDPPTLEPIGDKVVLEGERLVIDPVIGDADGDALTHQWLGDRPPHAVINGIYDFLPDETQGGEVYNVEYVVADPSGAEARESFTITVVETNQPPNLGVISDQQVFTGDPVTFDADATDPDVPAQVLTYSLEGAPAGATIDPVTGEFSWPSATVGGHVFDVVVRDDWSGSNGEDRWEVTILVIDPLSLPNDVSIDLSVLDGDPDGDGIVAIRDEVTLRATVAETNLGVGNVNVAVNIPGGASLLSSTGDACESFTVNTDTVFSCGVGTVNGSRDLDITLTLDDTKVYDIEAKVTSAANPETDVTNNTSSITMDARLMISISELIGVADLVDVVPPLNLATILEAIGVSDLVDVVPPLDLATILEAIAVGDGTNVVPPLTLDTILEAIGVTDSNGVVPPLDLATIIENIAVADSGNLIYDSDGNGNVDITVVGVDPVTGEAIVETAPGTQVLVASGGMVPGTTATVYLFSDPVHLTDVTVDAEGNFAVVVTIPEDTPPGDHRIIVTGEWAKGEGLLDVIFPIHVLGICTILGTDGGDILIGTRGDDVICGFGGNDVIFAGGGNDRVLGGPGNDLIFGGRGDDDLYGEEGNDVILGGRGADYLDGGPGTDLLIGGPGRDTRVQ